MILTYPKKLISQLTLLTIILAVLAVPTSVSAQNSLVLSVSPTLFEMTANPNQTWSSSVRVINANPYPITVYADPVNFAPADESGQGTLLPILESEAAGETLAEWISITQDEIEVPAEQTISVPFTISVPDSAAPGGHFAAILIGTRQPAGITDRPTVETSQVVTSLVFLRVSGDIVEAGSIREFTSDRQVYESADARFAIRFENTGNVHIQPQGEIEIRNMWGQERGIIPINKNSQFGNVLPESIRTYQYTWSTNWSLADIGRHAATVTLVYGENNRQFVDAVTYFWVIPWKLLLGTIFVVGALVGLIVFAIRLYVRRMLQLAGVTPELARTQKQTRVSVAAPLQAGILDLRDELENGTGTYIARWLTFMRRYRVGLVLLAAILIFVALIVWYIVLAVTTDYTYEVQLEQQDGTTIPISNTDNEAEPATSAEAVELVVINQTNQPAAVANLENRLAGQPITIIEQFEPVETVKERSVLVYDPDNLEELNTLQAALPGVLVSSFDRTNEDEPPLLLYIGNDLLSP